MRWSGRAGSTTCSPAAIAPTRYPLAISTFAISTSSSAASGPVVAELTKLAS